VAGAISVSLLRCLFNTNTLQWDFAPLNLHHNYCDVEIVFTNDSDIGSVEFGLDVATDGTDRYSLKFDSNFAYTYDMQDDYFNSVRIDYPIADRITVKPWVRYGAPITTGNYEFDRPTPPQPFPSWTFSDGSWHPPVPLPDDGLFYNWSEDTQAWLRVEFDEATQTWIEVTE
jgi:hypothetical protein